MDLLKKRILQDGKCFEGGILKVDSFINHQMDPILMKSIGVEFVRRFANKDFNKVMTIEASGIAPAANGSIDLIDQAGAQLAGMGFIIEKAFQHGGEVLRERGIHVESLAIIDSLDNCQIKIR